MRKLLNNVYTFLPKMYQGTNIKELEKAADLVVHTKAPGKWVLLDLETGQQYIGLEEPDQYGMWKRIK